MISQKKQQFYDPLITAKGKQRAWVDFKTLKILWFNTGTLCNLACENCYIESTPKNDRLVYLSCIEVVSYLDEIEYEAYPTKEIGITGGEPFMNPDIIPIMEETLKRGFRLLVLTNAMRPMMKCKKDLLRLKNKYGEHLTIRISVDHFKCQLHEEERGPLSWKPMLSGLKWLSDNDFIIDIAGRTRWGERDNELRQGFKAFFKEHNIKIDAYDRKQLMLFPEMDEKAAVPEITTDCWDVIGVKPDDMMCATSRMIVKHKGDDKPSVMACTLLAYDQNFKMGETLKDSSQSVYLNHPHCAKFCVLGGGSCSATKD